MFESPGTVLVADAQTEVRRHLDEGEIENFWWAVSETLRRVFNVMDPDPIVERLRRRVSEAGSETELFFYHCSPYQIAADITGSPTTELSEDQKQAYAQVLKEWIASSYLLGKSPAS